MLKVLLVDDDRLVTAGLTKLIPWDQLGASVIGVKSNGSGAFQCAMEDRPDLIISDIKMPVMDGLELCRKISEAMFDTTIILLSAYEDFSYARTAMQYGVKDYILKPMDWGKIDQLTARVRELSHRVEVRRELYSEPAMQGIQSRLDSILKAGREDELSALFDTLFAKYSTDSDLVKELCFKLVGHLFRPDGNLSLGAQSPLVDKAEAVNRLFSLKSIDGLKEYTFGIYRNLLHWINERKDTRTVQLVEEAHRYIDANFGDSSLTVASVADRFHITANYLSILFRQVRGINISTYIVSLRIGRAKRLLREKNVTIADVCRMSGYFTVRCFSRTFKKTVGMTPTEYHNVVGGFRDEGETA